MDEGLNSDGFLSEEMIAVQSVIAEKYGPAIDTVRRVNRFAVKTQYSLSADADDLQKLLVAMLFARTLAHTQAAILMIERGMDAQARVMLRAGMEALFSLGAIVNDPRNATKFFDADAIQRRKLSNKSLRWTSPALKEVLEKEDVSQIKGDIDAQIAATGATSLSAEYMADEAGLTDWYLTAYAIFSYSVHSNVRDLMNHHLDNDGEGNATSIKNEPSSDSLGGLFLTAAQVILVALGAIGSLFGIEEAAKFSAEEHQTLAAVFKGDISHKSTPPIQETPT
jgi:Family of unknown function (DUF5677)